MKPDTDQSKAPEAKSVPQPESKPDAKDESKSESKPDAKPDAKNDLKSLPLAAVEKKLGSSPDGLTQAEAVKRLTQYGPNEIEGLGPLLLQQLQKKRILAVAETAYRFPLGRIIGIAPGKIDPARLQEALHAVIARLPVDVASIIADAVEWCLRPAGPSLQKFVKHLLPCRRMQLRRPGDHAVKIEDHRVVMPGRQNDFMLRHSPSSSRIRWKYTWA
ncbi:MAG: cation-transporting P-type ATPase [Thiobacillus sp.]